MKPKSGLLKGESRENRYLIKGIKTSFEKVIYVSDSPALNEEPRNIIINTKKIIAMRKKPKAQQFKVNPELNH